MAITAPWSAALKKSEGKKDVVFPGSGASAHIAGSIVLSIGSGVDPGKRQQVLGVMEAMKGYYLNRVIRNVSTDTYVKGDWIAGANKNITHSAAAPAATDIGISVSATFYGTPGAQGSHFFVETLDQLIDIFKEQSKDN